MGAVVCPMTTHTLADFQQDMRRGYQWGASGIITSGAVWLAAAFVALTRAPAAAVWTLFLGAMAIVPVANLLDRMLGAPGRHTPGNPLARLAMEGTVWMIACLPAAYALSLQRIEWFFPAVLMVIGGRYLTFATLYGSRMYWVLGGLLGSAAWGCVTLRATPALAAAVGGGIEVLFGIALLLWVRARGDRDTAERGLVA
jgi:hypothetical protein